MGDAPAPGSPVQTDNSSTRPSISDLARQGWFRLDWWSGGVPGVGSPIFSKYSLRRGGVGSRQHEGGFHRAAGPTRVAGFRCKGCGVGLR